MEKDVNEYMKNYEPYGGEYHSSEVFVPKERLFLLLILMKLLNLDKVVYVIGLSNEEEMKEILEIDKEIKKAHRRATIILVSSLISITFLIIWGICNTFYVSFLLSDLTSFYSSNSSFNNFVCVRPNINNYRNS